MTAAFVENNEFTDFARRIMRAMARRAAGDVDLLPGLLAVQHEIDQLMRQAVSACRAEGYSWSEIAQRLGTTKQAAQQRYGQPADLPSRRA
jgi:DNA-directed RNA polymerase specialized sigma24 family protein